jgi:serine acetyltransferase
MLLYDPARLWALSCRLWREGKRRQARLIKFYCFQVFRAVLPPEAELKGTVRLGHYAMNIVVHPDVTMGHDVFLWHNVTLSVSHTPGAGARLIIGDRVLIGTGAVVVTPLRGSLEICNDVVIGANAVVSRSITEPGTYVGMPARLVRSSDRGFEPEAEEPLHTR